MPQKIRCEIVELVSHGERVYSVSLKPDSPAPRFTAGQFLHLALDPYHPGDFWPDSRAFSIASPPTQRNLLTITYAVKGEFTRRMDTELTLGSVVWIKLPYGEFAVRTDQDACLLAGGTGVTAFTAFIGGLEPNYPHQVYVFYGARNSDLLIYRSPLESAAKRCANLKLFFLIEEGKDPASIAGRINLDIVWRNIPDVMSMTYYLSGPPVMIKTLSSELLDRSVPLNQVIIDAWD